MSAKNSLDYRKPNSRGKNALAFSEGLKALHQEIMFLQMELIRGENLVMPQYFLLRYISMHDPQHLSSMAGFLKVSNPTVTGLTDTLESQGWVKRQPDPNDRRGTLILLTEKSLELFSRMEEYQMKLMDNILEGTDESRLNELGQILSGLAVKVRKVVMENTDRKGKDIL
ncbi:MAG: MarR family winged helix-turn-helix transcriptional regulator [Thermoplasmataceae archaeon]